MKNNIGGLVLLNKPSGITSFRALNVLKKTLGTGKVGHTGTLDKFADGLIVTLFGKMTKLVPEFTGMDKEYIALIHFGIETETLDPEGDMVYEADPPELSNIEKAIPSFIGKIQQVPPQYSAIHINGKRAYEIVRSGEEVEIPSREIEIYSFDIISYEKPYLKVKIKCSKGTYIRSIARDLALECGSRAHLKELKRTVVGPFQLEQSCSSEDFNIETNTMTPWQIFDFLDNVDKVIIDKKFIKEIQTGKEWVLKEIAEDFADNKEFALFDDSFDLIGLIKKENGLISYRFVC
jgi:tRNA pseudouridine55 synthase